MRHTNIRRAGAVGLAATALVLGLGACSDDDPATVDTTVPAGGDDTATTQAPEAGGGDTITIRDFAYNELTVAPGTEVTVTNADGAPHTVTSSDDAFEEVTVGAAESGTFTAPAEPGSYEYVCTVHGAATMTGTLVVE